MNERSLAEELAALRAEIGPKLARIESVMNDLLTRRVKRGEQAKRLGVSRVTLWRREQKVAADLRVNRLSRVK